MGKQHPEHTKLHALPGRSCGTREGRQDELRPSSPDRDVNEAARNEGMKPREALALSGLTLKIRQSIKKNGLVVCASDEKSLPA
jgi:hypothetical protein